MRSSLLRLLAAPLVLAGTPLATAAQDAPPSEGSSPESQAAEASAPAAGEDPDAILGEPLVVNGAVVPVEEIKRAIVTGDVGRQVLESAKLQVFIDEEIDRQLEAGADPERFRVTDEEIEAAIEEADAIVRSEFEGQENAPKTARDLYPMPDELWQDSIRQTRLFNKVFLPEDPSQYSETTRAALEGQNPGLVEKLIEGYEQRKASGVEQPQEGKQLFNTLMGQLVVGAMTRAAEIKTAADGIPPELAMVVNGEEIRTDDVWKAIRYKVSERDVYRAKRWFAKTIALRQALEEAGAYLDDETFSERYREHTEPYENSPFNIPTIAVALKKFPSEDAYKEHFRLIESYERMLGEELDDEALRSHHEKRTKQLLGLARADVEVLLIAAYDFEQARFPEGAWERAAERATEALRRLAEGEPWEQVLEDASEWYDPPVAKSAANMAQQSSRDKGRFGLVNRNELMQKLGESEYEVFLTGRSLTDTIFFGLEAGVPSQPLRGPHGYYIALVKSRTAPNNRISLDNESHRDLVRQDYLSVGLNAFGEAQIDSAEIRGLQP